jgi:hypothetical protein
MGSGGSPVSCLGLFTGYDMKQYDRPRNKEELFNLRHACLRNVIERIFGVLKRRFRILLVAPAFNLSVQSRIPVALSALHNFIREHDTEEEYAKLYAMGKRNAADIAEEDDSNLPNANLDEDQTSVALRDQIAQQMWVDYQKVLAERGMVYETEVELEVEDGEHEDGGDGDGGED